MSGKTRNPGTTRQQQPPSPKSKSRQPTSPKSPKSQQQQQPPSAPTIPTEVSSKISLKNHDPKKNEAFMHLEHFSNISKLKLSANPDDYRLSEFNLERIHRFVDEPNSNLGAHLMEVYDIATTKNPKTSKGILRNLQPGVPTHNGGSSVSVSVIDNDLVKGEDGKYRKVSNPHIIEHDKSLGVKSRFGDGDGTFWDRWVVTTGSLTGDDYAAGGNARAGAGSAAASGGVEGEVTVDYISASLPTQSSYKSGSSQPKSGYKRFMDGGGSGFSTGHIGSKGMLETTPGRVGAYRYAEEEDSNGEEGRRRSWRDVSAPDLSRGGRRETSTSTSSGGRRESSRAAFASAFASASASASTSTSNSNSNYTIKDGKVEDVKNRRVLKKSVYNKIYSRSSLRSKEPINWDNKTIDSKGNAKDDSPGSQAIDEMVRRNKSPVTMPVTMPMVKFAVAGVKKVLTLDKIVDVNDSEDSEGDEDEDDDANDDSADSASSTGSGGSNDPEDFLSKLISSHQNTQQKTLNDLDESRKSNYLRRGSSQLYIKKTGGRPPSPGSGGKEVKEGEKPRERAFVGFAQKAVVRRERGVNILPIRKNTGMDEVTQANYFGLGGGDMGESKTNFYELHKQLARQKNHFTIKEFDKLIMKKSELAEEELKADKKRAMAVKEQSLLSHSGQFSTSDDLKYKDLYDLTLTLPSGEGRGKDDPDPDLDDFDIEYLQQITGTYGNATARTRYLFGCIRARNGSGIPPRMGPIIRKFRTVKIDLSHQGIGDELGLIFAEALCDLPQVQRINLTDNRLTDVGVAAVIEAIMDKKDLLQLILGHNKVDGDAAEKLALYIERPSCPIKELGLSHADIDDGECVRFIDALANNKNLTNLDLSHNMIGSDENLNVVNPDLITGGEAIAAMLSSSGCNLKTLNLSWNLIRFNSAVELGDALSQNDSLTDLDLAYNAFGADGGMAVGQALFDNTRLLRLNIQNNGITPQAAFCVAVALRQNISLLHINLAGNPVGYIGGKALMALPMELGDRLDMNLDGCNFKAHDSKCWFDPDGPSGYYSNLAESTCKMILGKYEVFDEKSAKLCISLTPELEEGKMGLSRGIKDPRDIRVQLGELVSQLHPQLVLSYPYDRAVLIELLRFVSEMDGCALLQPESDLKIVDENFVKLTYIDVNGNAEILELERVVVSAKPLEGDRELLKWMQGSEFDLAQLFHKFDADGSGEIDKEELTEMFKVLGKEITERQIERVITQYDIDGSGSIEVNEFVDFITQLQYELKESTMKKQFMSLPKKYLPWRPPAEGKVELKVIYNPRLSDDGEGVSTNNETIDRVIELVKKTNGESAAMLTMSLSMMRLGVEEAQRIFDELLKGIGDRVETLKRVLPMMATPTLARVFIDLNLKERDPYRNGMKCEVSRNDGSKTHAIIMRVENNEILVSYEGGGTEACKRSRVHLTGTATVSVDAEKRRLQSIMGSSYYPILGIPTSHYKLDMSKDVDRLTLAKLAAINNTETNRRRKQMLGDTSQRGNWMNFRNERFRGEAITITQGFLDPGPKAGLLEFDFVSTARPAGSIVAMTDKRFSQLIDTVFPEVGEDEDVNVETLLANLETAMTKSFMHGLYSPKVREMGEEFGLKLAVLYREISEEDIEKAEEVEAKGVSASEAAAGLRLMAKIKSKNNVVAAAADSGANANADGKTAENDSEDEADDDEFVEEEVTEYQPKKAAEDHDYQLSRGRNRGATQHNLPIPQSSAMKRLSQYMVSAARVDLSRTTKVDAHNLLSEMQDMVSCRYITAIQGRFLVDEFHKLLGRTVEDANLRLQLILTLHSRVVDLHNFDFLISGLGAEDQARIVYSLGWLNTWSPIKPDLFYELTQSRREERIVSKCLLHLAVEEPGENWWDETFQWNRFERTIPGWELPVTWFTEDGMPSKGILKLTYYSGEGKHKSRCAPAWKLRNALSGLVLAESPSFIAKNEFRLWDSELPFGRDQVSIAQNMLLKCGVKLNYRQKGN